MQVGCFLQQVVFPWDFYNEDVCLTELGCLNIEMQVLIFDFHELDPLTVTASFDGPCWQSWIAHREAYAEQKQRVLFWVTRRERYHSFIRHSRNTSLVRQALRSVPKQDQVTVGFQVVESLDRCGESDVTP